MNSKDLLLKIEEKLNAKENKRQTRLANGDFFNIFELCGIDNKENIHSNIIARLLNPQWKHGQGNIFLEKFCKRFNITFDTTPETTVSREEVIKDNRRPDIVIRNGANLIVIENKIGTCDHEEQLQDYWNWMLAPQNGCKTLIYLTKYGEHPRCEFNANITGDNCIYKQEEYKSADNVSSYTVFQNDKHPDFKFILLPYSEIMDWCANCSILPGIPNSVRDSFSQYANFIYLWLNNEIDDSDIVNYCIEDENIQTVIQIYNSNENTTSEARKWIKQNYNLIIKSYIAKKFPSIGWNGNLLETSKIGESIFRITIEFVNDSRSQFIRVGIAQTDSIDSYEMESIKNEINNIFQKQKWKLKECNFKYKNNASKKAKHDCWWVFYNEIKQISSRVNIDKIIDAAQILANVNNDKVKQLHAKFTKIINLFKLLHFPAPLSPL